MSNCSFKKYWESNFDSSDRRDSSNSSETSHATYPQKNHATSKTNSSSFSSLSVLLERAIRQLWHPMWCSQGSVTKLVEIELKTSVFCCQIAVMSWTVLYWQYCTLLYIQDLWPSAVPLPRDQLEVPLAHWTPAEGKCRHTAILSACLHFWENSLILVICSVTLMIINM